MKISRQDMAMFSVIIAISLMVNSCVKKPMCNKDEATQILEIHNHIMDDTKDAEKLKKANDDTDYINKLSEIFQQGARELNQFKITNEKSLDFKSRLFKSYEGTSKALDDRMKAAKNKNQPNFIEASQNLEDSKKDRDQVIEDIKNTCLSNPNK